VTLDNEGRLCYANSCTMAGTKSTWAEEMDLDEINQRAQTDDSRNGNTTCCSRTQRSNDFHEALQRWKDRDQTSHFAAKETRASTKKNVRSFIQNLVTEIFIITKWRQIVRNG
jgi:hypothetical protein